MKFNSMQHSKLKKLTTLSDKDVDALSVVSGSDDNLVGLSDGSTEDASKPRRRRRSNAQLLRDVLCPFNRCEKCYASKHALQLHIRNKHLNVSSAKMGGRTDDIDNLSLNQSSNMARERPMFSSSMDFEPNLVKSRTKYASQPTSRSSMPYRSVGSVPTMMNSPRSSASFPTPAPAGFRNFSLPRTNNNLTSASLESFTRNCPEPSPLSSISDDQIMSLLSEILSAPSSQSNTLPIPAPSVEEEPMVVENFLDDIFAQSDTRLETTKPSVPYALPNPQTYQPQVYQAPPPTVHHLAPPATVHHLAPPVSQFRSVPSVSMDEFNVQDFKTINSNFAEVQFRRNNSLPDLQDMSIGDHLTAQEHPSERRLSASIFQQKAMLSQQSVQNRQVHNFNTRLPLVPESPLTRDITGNQPSWATLDSTLLVNTQQTPSYSHFGTGPNPIA
eukprot:CFRG3036T1